MSTIKTNPPQFGKGISVLEVLEFSPDSGLH